MRKKKPIRNLAGLQSEGNVYLFPAWAQAEFRNSFPISKEISMLSIEEIQSVFNANIDNIEEYETKIGFLLSLNIPENDPDILELEYLADLSETVCSQIIHYLHTKGYTYYSKEDKYLEIPMRESKGK